MLLHVGFDALSQCIESYWSVSSTNKSRNYSVKGMKLILSNIINATLKNSKFAKHEMAIAANFSGKLLIFQNHCTTLLIL